MTAQPDPQPSTVHILTPRGQARPLPREEVRDLLRRRLLPPGTLYWQAGMTAWEPLVPDLRRESGTWKARPSAEGRSPDEPKSPVLLARLAKFTLGVTLIMIAVLVANDVASFLLHAGPYTEGQLRAKETREMGLSILALLALMMATAFFFAWLYRANKNCHQVGAKEMRFSPGWMVGWWFIPIANLWKPFQAVRELDRASQAPRGTEWQENSPTPLIPLWWGLNLTSIALEIAVIILAWDPPTDSAHQLAAAFSAVYNLLYGVILILTILIITRITHLQGEISNVKSQIPNNG